MPGDILSFNCPCGFQKKEIYVGVNDAHVHFTIFLCLQCGKMVIAQKSPKGHFDKTCRKCGMELTAMTDPGTWQPASLQQRFPDSEPWMVFNEIVELEHEEAEKLIPLADEIRILCPKCKKYTLKLEESGCWD